MAIASFSSCSSVQTFIQEDMTEKKTAEDQLKSLFVDFEKYHKEYSETPPDGMWQEGYFKGKLDAYAYAAKKVKDAIQWLDIPVHPAPLKDDVPGDAFPDVTSLVKEN